MTIGLLGIASRPASATMISNFDGVAGDWSLLSNGTDGDLVFDATFTTLLNGASAGTVMTTIDDFTVDATSGVGNTYSFDPSTYPGGLVYDDGGMAVFDLELISLTVLNPNSMMILGTIQLDTNSSSEDFSLFASTPGEIILTLNKPAGGPGFVDIIESGGTMVHGSGSFSASYVPEPSSYVLAGFALSAFIVAFRRRFRRRQS